MGSTTKSTEANAGMALDRDDFGLFLQSINRCYGPECANRLPQTTDFPADIFGADDKLRIDSLIDFASTQSDKYLLSVINRIIAVANIQQSRDRGGNLDIKSAWRLITHSILTIPSESTISSIGSQGFLSIPLYIDDRVKAELEFIRIHIWDNSLSEYIDKEKCRNFSIHCHSFFARSWVVFGKVINDRYLVTKCKGPAEQSLFTIGFNGSPSNINRHVSSATNAGIDVFVEQISHEIYMSGATYRIEAGDFHKSGTAHEGGLSATIFSFTAKDGFLETSYVIGPRQVMTSEINRRMHIDPIKLLNKLDAAIHES